MTGPTVEDFAFARDAALTTGAPWTLTLAQFRALWGADRWRLRGPGPQDFALRRVDPRGAWSIENAVVETGEQHRRRRARLRANAKAAKAKRAHEEALDRAIHLPSEPPPDRAFPDGDLTVTEHFQAKATRPVRTSAATRYRFRGNGP